MEEQLRDYFRGKTVLIYGGTGSWGSELTQQLIERCHPGEVRIFSRGEHKQVAMRHRYHDVDNIHYIIGDVRDAQRVATALKGVNVAFNLAAIKHVPVCEENVWEAIQTNIHGPHNIVQAAMMNGVETVVQVSTDKAVDPLNLYGFTKGCAEKLFTSANFSPYKPHGTRFVCVRGGNVLSTKGSVVPLFKEQIRKHNKITLTDDNMGRYLMRVSQAIQLVLKATIEALGGEIFVMKMPGVRIIDLAEVIIEQIGDSSTKIERVGIRPGEKMYEVLVSHNESFRTVEDGEYYVILPDVYEKSMAHLAKYAGHKKFLMAEYTSRNTTQLSKAEILQLLEEDRWLDDDKYLDPM